MPTIPTQNKGQRRLMDQYTNAARQGPQDYWSNPTYQAGNSYLQGLLSNDEGAFDQFQAPYQREYQRNVGNIANQFGGAGALSSSAFQQALGGATTDLSEKLASLRGNLQMQALPQALQYAGAPLEHGRSLLDMQTQSYVPKQPSWWQTALTGLTSGVTSGLSGGFSGFLGKKLFGS